jgi:hypothetical protein
MLLVTFLHCLEENVLFCDTFIGEKYISIRTRENMCLWFFSYDHESQNGAPMREIL